ncbi:phosphoglycerate kinase [Modestobacter sp. Leaf380]|nr:phosphoglycerate kinase [Modestobacter sp. Leaf380]
MSTVYVVTHPEASHHTDGLVGGWFDSTLTTRGHRQAESIARRLVELLEGRQTTLYSSTLTRTLQTAAPIGERLGVEVVELADLREKSYGVAGGRPQRWLDERFIFPPEVGERMAHDEGIEGAETKLQWVTRAYRALEEIERDGAEQRVVVTHAGTANWVIAAWLRLPVEACSYAHFELGSGGITTLVDGGPFGNRTLRSLDDRAHLINLRSS